MRREIEIQARSSSEEEWMTIAKEEQGNMDAERYITDLVYLASEMRNGGTEFRAVRIEILMDKREGER